MTPKTKLIYCLLGNFSLVILVIVINMVANDDSPYFRMGPNDDLLIISTKINTMGRYMALLFMISTINIVSVIVEDIGMPLLEFNIYNPDKKIITEFTKNELNFFANAMYLASNIRNSLMILVTVSQIDIALFGVFIKEIVSIFIIRLLLKEKKFTHSKEEIELLDTSSDEGNM